MTEVKICGICTPDTMDAVAAAGAEWVGFVFVPASPRAVAPALAAGLAARHPAGPAPVGLFVRPSDAEVERVLRHLPLAALQVHADPARAEALQARFGVPVWLGVGVATRADLPTATESARLLLDAKAPPDASLPGGNAQPFDWTLLQGWSAPVPWLLAGGLTPANVGAAIRQSGARAVDVSSGVERRRGEKDPALIHAFVAAAKAA